jgi:hypothetical protein
MRPHLAVLVVCSVAAVLLGCPGLSEPPCLVGFSDSFSAYLVQLRPRGDFPAGCPQGQQYQILWPSMYTAYGKQDPPPSVAFQLAGSTVDPPSGAQATGRFTTYFTPGSDVCTVPELTPAVDDSATPVNAPAPAGSTTYAFSEMKVLSDAAHRGNQFEALAVVDYGIPGCEGLQYVAQAVFPMTPCLDDSICLPDVVPDDVLPPAGRGLGSQLSRDYRAFCNLDPALLGNAEIAAVLSDPLFGAGPGAYVDAEGNPHDVGVCFFSEPFPSLCRAGSTLSTSGPCVVGPGSNPH